MDHEKILPFDGCERTFADLRARGERIVHCHGAFDLLHPGHLKHLEEARRQGTVLVVTLTSAPFVNKGPGRPIFSDQQRAYQLAHLAIVDHVVVVPKTGAVEIIERVRPHVYCKGVEYQAPKDETAKRISEDQAAVERVGGEVRFIGEALYSSTRLISANLDALEPEVREYLESFAAEEALTSLDASLAKIRDLSVLVVGDLIVDRYTYCRVQGLTSKAKVLSVRPSEDEDQLGGSLAVARQVATFGCRTTLLAVAGTEPFLDAALEPIGQALRLELVRSPRYPTILKQRYVERQGVRQDLAKLFAVNRLIDEPPADVRERLLETLAAELARADLVIVCDYGHGLVDARAQELLARAPYLALNCQTNSYNYGFNLITKYPRCDLFALDETELLLACGKRTRAFGDELEQIARRLETQQAWLTLGSSGSIVWRPDGTLHSCPAMTKRVVDTVGAGDAFFATAALCGRVGADLPLASVLANLSGAMAASWAGNKDVVQSSVVVKNARYLLKSAVK